MSQELIERIEKFRERGCDTETHVLLCDCRDELTKQAEYKRKAEIWDYLCEAIEHTSRLSDELPDGTAGSSKEDIVNASLDVWREQQKKILALEGHIAKQADQIETLRMQLAACDVAALQNTRESLETRIPKDNPYYSAAYRSVCDAVDREIAHREGCTKQAERVKALEEYRNTNEDLIGTLLDSLEKIESHFSDKGELEGEGKWRLDSIYKAVQQANEAVDKCVAARKQSQLAAVLNDSTGGKQ